MLAGDHFLLCTVPLLTFQFWIQAARRGMAMRF
jgi:hypothetical protein